MPEDPYGIAKYAVELDLAAAHEMFGLDYTVFRPHNVYGERQNIADRYRNVIGIFMNRVLRGQPMPVFGDGADAGVLPRRRCRADDRAKPTRRAQRPTSRSTSAPTAVLDPPARRGHR